MIASFLAFFSGAGEHRLQRSGVAPILSMLLLACVLLFSACGSKTNTALQNPALSPTQAQKTGHKDSLEPDSSSPVTTPSHTSPATQPTDVSEKTDAWDDALYDEWDDDYDDLDDEYALMDSEGAGATIADPLEPFNRAMFTLNDKLYFWVLKPTASVYGAVFPRQMRTGINNVFNNLAFPIRFVSSLLQLKWDKAFKEVGAFAMNTTFGIGGLVKISDHIEPLNNLSPEDLGQTLAHYGVGDGFYIVWPFLGPSTLRDTSGSIGEYFLDPINYIDEWEIRWALKGESTLNYTSLHIGDYEDLKDASIDPYEALKDFYTQHRRHLTRDRE